MIRIWKWGLCLSTTDCALPRYMMPWWVTEEAIFSERNVSVPPLNLPDRAQKKPSFHRLEPPLNSINFVCLRQIALGKLVSCNKRIVVLIVVSLKRFLISLRLLRPDNPWPSPRVFWIAMVSLSPFIHDKRVIRRRGLPPRSGLRTGCGILRELGRWCWGWTSCLPYSTTRSAI